MQYTKGNPAHIERMQDQSLKFHGLAGRGATAPGCVVIRELPGNEVTPYVVHFGNTQDGGYYFGNYCQTLEGAEEAFQDKISRYDRDGALHHAFKYDL